MHSCVVETGCNGCSLPDLFNWPALKDMCIAKNVPMQRDHVKPCVVYYYYFYCVLLLYCCSMANRPTKLQKNYYYLLV